MKATDKQLLDICAELTAHIIKPIEKLNLSADECIILNRLICEEFERREEQDVMGSSNGQDTPLGQSGADNNDGNINASERRDSEVSGVEVRKEKTQITKVSKKEYWENRDKHGTYPRAWDEWDKVDTNETTEETPHKSAPDPDRYLPLSWLRSQQNRFFNDDEMFHVFHAAWNIWLSLPYCERDAIMSSEQSASTNEKTEEITQLDDLKDTEETNSEIKVSKGAMSIDAYKLFGQSFDEKCFRFNGVPLLDKYIPVAWMRERIRANDDISDAPYADNYRKVIDSWEAFGKDSWYQNRHYDPSVYFETTD